MALAHYSSGWLALSLSLYSGIRFQNATLPWHLLKSFEVSLISPLDSHYAPTAALTPCPGSSFYLFKVEAAEGPQRPEQCGQERTFLRE